MTTLRSLIAAVALALLAGCGGEAVSRAPTDNKEFAVDKLFTHDGCTVYRFRDAGDFRYFVRCSDGTHATFWVESCGRGCRREHSLTTLPWPRGKGPRQTTRTPTGGRQTIAAPSY